MKPKKSKHADEERMRGIFFKLGLICSMTVVILAFTWSSRDSKDISLQDNFNYAEAEEITDVTWQKPQKPLVINNPVLKIVSRTVPFDSNLQNLFRVDVKPTDSIVFDFPEDTAEVDYDPYGFIPLEKRPEFPGGEIELARFLKANIVYPEPERSYDVQGVVVVAFVVEKDGSLSDIHVVKSVSPNIDHEAVRVVSKMPLWTPGIQRDKPVKAGFHLPIRFTIVH